MSWNRGRSRSGKGKWSPPRKKKNFLQENKKFTGILLLICMGALLGVHLFMWQVHDKTCEVSCGNPDVGCWTPIGYTALFGPCHGYNARTNQTQIGFKT
jgi:hypothetical protein